MNKKIINKVILIIGILIIVILPIILQKTGAINRIANLLKAENEENMETAVKYEITKTEGENINIIITVESAKGIEKISTPELEIEYGGKQKVALDRTVKDGIGYFFSVKLEGQEEQEKYTIIATNNPLVQVANYDTLQDGTTKTIKINRAGESLITHYSLDDGETWQEYNGVFDVLESDNYTITAKSEVKEGKLIDNNDGDRRALVVSESLISATGNAIMKNDNYYRIAARDKEYSVHTYIENESITLESNKTYGDANDVGTSNANAKNMVIVKVNGNLTINEGVTLGPYYSSYGGPKGFLLYCTETLTNNGTIQNNYGAIAPGENVYLWKNANKSYEYVPATGAAGGAAITGVGINTAINGRPGQNANTVATLSGSGVRRATAGGAGGAIAVLDINGRQNGSAGGTGTSYGAGAGGGGTSRQRNSGGLNPNHANTTRGGSGALLDGGSGDLGSAAAGGAGASIGYGYKSSLARLAQNGGLGTGGLLITYAENIIIDSKGTFTSIGANGGDATAFCGNVSGRNHNGGASGGGASGGGSLNIFTKQITLIEDIPISSHINISGGRGGRGTLYQIDSNYGRAASGGAGGTGSCNIGYINEGTYESYYSNN